MSTPATPNPGQTVVSDADVEAYIRQVAADELKKAGTVVDPPTAQPVKLNIAGEDKTFKDINEAQAFINEREGRYQQALQQANAPKPQSREVTDDRDTGPQWDQKHYVDLMVEDPRKAADYLDEFRYGVKDPVTVIKNTLSHVNQLATEAVVRNFADRHTDWEPNEHNAGVMQNLVTEMNLPISPSALDAAYAVAQKRGLLKLTPKADPAPAPQTEYNPYLAPPPVAARGAANTPSSTMLSDFENLSLEQMEKVLERFGR